MEKRPTALHFLRATLAPGRPCSRCLASPCLSVWPSLRPGAFPALASGASGQGQGRRLPSQRKRQASERPPERDSAGRSLWIERQCRVGYALVGVPWLASRRRAAERVFKGTISANSGRSARASTVRFKVPFNASLLKVEVGVLRQTEVTTPTGVRRASMSSRPWLYLGPRSAETLASMSMIASNSAFCVSGYFMMVV